jgi:pimeloyl-ACP methyl ester carboxylesterase
MNLFFKTLGEGQPLLILHGLFGSADNWLTHARNWSQHYKVYLIDQRNHGHSPHADTMSYELMAEDLFELIARENLRDIMLLGHSMGGKTAMTFAQEYPFLIEKMVVVDMGIKPYPPHHQIILEGLNALDIAHCASRQEAEKHLLHYVPDDGTRQFLLKNMYWKNPGELAWRFNLPVLTRDIGRVMEGLSDTVCQVETLFLRGALSNYVPDADFQSINTIFPMATFQTIAHAGHWVHAESPDDFSHEVLAFLNGSPRGL